MRQLAPTQIRCFACTLGLAILMALGPAGAARAQEPVPDAVATLASGIQSVVSGGYWSSGDQEGFFRAVTVAGGVEHVSMALYLQWLGVDVDTNSSRLLATIPVAEVNSAFSGGRVFDIAMDKDAEFGTLHLVVSVRPSAPGLLTRFDLTASGDIGHYSIAKAE